MKAGQWIDNLASVKKVHPDGTYDVAVYKKFLTEDMRFGRLEEELVLTKKPYPSEVKEANPQAAARLASLAAQPPDFFEKYTVSVVREHGGREEWGRVDVNGPGFKWAETARPREAKWHELICSSRVSFIEHIPGSDEKNQTLLRAEIRRATGWNDVGDIYCGGTKLETFHMFRVHGIFCAGRPLVVLAEGESTYDRERWREIAERPTSDSCCVVS